MERDPECNCGWIQGHAGDCPATPQNKRIRALEAENRVLRGLVQTNPDWHCPHGMNVENITECPSGFPGCACADDQISVLCEDSDRIVQNLKAELSATRSELAEAKKDSERLDWLERLEATGYAFPVWDRKLKTWCLFHHDDSLDICKFKLRDLLDAARAAEESEGE